MNKPLKRTFRFFCVLMPSANNQTNVQTDLTSYTINHRHSETNAHSTMFRQVGDIVAQK